MNDHAPNACGRVRRHGSRPLWGAPRVLAPVLLLMLAVMATAPAWAPLLPAPRLPAPLAQQAAETSLAERVDALIAPYRARMEAQMGEVLAHSPLEMRTGRPEGLLGALAADIILDAARAASGLPVSVCVLNNGGLRAPLPAGPVTLGQVYEIMPFDNEIVVLELSAEQVRILADQIAARGGEPVAGLTFQLSGERAESVRVEGRPLAEKAYWVATNSYLAQGGGGMPVLWEPQGRPVLTGVLIRDALIEAFRRAGASGPTPAAAVRAVEAAAPAGRLHVPDMGRIVVTKEAAR